MSRMKKYRIIDYIGIAKAVVAVAIPQNETITSFLAKKALAEVMQAVSLGRVLKFKKAFPLVLMADLAKNSVKLLNVCSKIMKSVRQIEEKNFAQVVTRIDSRYCDAALLAMNVYPNKTGSLPDGWRISHECDSILTQQDNIFVKLYVNERGTKRYAMAFAGTVMTNVEDWQANIYQLKGISDHYRIALTIAKKVLSYVSARNAQLTFVGHSKGGGMATLCALALGREAIVFNPAGVSESTLKICGIGNSCIQSSNNIVSIIAYNDVLSLIQDSARELSYSIVPECKTPVAIGRRIYVDSYCDKFIDAHDIGKMNDAFQSKRIS